MRVTALFRGMLIAFVVFAFDCKAGPTNGAPAVQVFFEGGSTLSAKALENIARMELAKKGATNLSEFQCTINVSMRGTNKGAFVLFTKGFGQPYHQVSFNGSGRISLVHSGTAQEFVGDASELSKSPSQ